MKVQGAIVRIEPEKQISSKFRKSEFTIEYAPNPMYPQYITFQCVQDKADMLREFAEGQLVEVEFNLRGRKWDSPQGETKYFNSLDCWRIKAVEGEKKTQPVVATEDPDDLPF